LFRFFAKKNKQFSNHHFWQYTNDPVELYSNEVIVQKINHNHQNPVAAGIATDEASYFYSSASLVSPLEMDELLLLKPEAWQLQDVSEGGGMGVVNGLMINIDDKRMINLFYVLKLDC